MEREEQKGERETVEGRPPKEPETLRETLGGGVAEGEAKKDSRAQRSRDCRDLERGALRTGRGRGTARMLPAWERCLDRLHPWRGLNHSSSTPCRDATRSNPQFRLAAAKPVLPGFCFPEWLVLRQPAALRTPPRRFHGQRLALLGADVNEVRLPPPPRRTL